MRLFLFKRRIHVILDARLTTVVFDSIFIYFPMKCEEEIPLITLLEKEKKGISVAFSPKVTILSRIHW